jgi:predicted type IV restriction endonuclease
MSAPSEIVKLVQRFERNAEAYRSAHYNEAQARQEFVNPFFKCLGWDMDNEQGHAEAYKDVIHEDAIKVGSATKAPDYCFRIGGTRKFFLEGRDELGFPRKAAIRVFPRPGLQREPERIIG